MEEKQSSETRLLVVDTSISNPDFASAFASLSMSTQHRIKSKANGRRVEASEVKGVADNETDIFT